MEADNDRLNSKLQGATIVDLDAVRRAREMSGAPSAKPAVSAAPRNIALIILAVVFVAYLLRVLR